MGTETREAPKRLRAGDVIDGYREIIDQLSHRQARVGDASVTFTRNAKGETQISVEVSAPVGTDAAQLGDTVLMAYGEPAARDEEALQHFRPGPVNITPSEAKKRAATKPADGCRSSVRL